MKDLKQYATDYFWSQHISKTLLEKHYYKANKITSKWASSTIQQKMDIDRLCSRNGKRCTIEEKIVDGNYTNVLLETHSTYLSNQRTPGWMETGQAEILLWVFASSGSKQLRILEIDFKKLKALYLANRMNFESAYLPWVEKSQRHTRSLLVPIKKLEEMGVLISDQTIPITEAIPTKQEVVKRIKAEANNVESNGAEG